MFIIYHSNQANLFKNLLIDIISNKLLFDPMQSEIILTENNIINQWIQIELANHFGIACNITFMTLQSFAQYIFQKINSDDNAIDNFSHSIMYWKFLEILSQEKTMKEYPIVHRYLYNDINQKKLSQFSEQLAYLFAQYLIYRPDWLNSWQYNKTIKNLDNVHQNWQSKIWRFFLGKTLSIEKEFKTNINPLQFCIYFLKKNPKINCNLPNRIFVFGITCIPPIYWKILKILSQRIDIYLWFINPYYHNLMFTHDQNSYFKRKQSKQLHIKNVLHPSTSISNDYIDYNNHTINYHPLLNSWGTVARNTLSLLNQLKNKIELKSFILPKEDSLLHIIQKDIFKMYNYTTSLKKKKDAKKLKNNQRYILASEDQSITCHVCHSIQREVEVLHDNLLSMITKDPSLSTGDIVVMVANIRCYISTIRTVFNNMQNRHLPFNITDNYKENTHPIIATFLNILDLPHSRFTSEEILSFLAVSSVASRFNISKEEVKLLRQWTMKSGVRWGLDKITMYNFDLPIINQNTWDFGLTRMLLGYAIKTQHDIWEGILPYNDITNRENSDIIGKLGEFLKTLKKWRNRFIHSYTLTKWKFYFIEIIDDFFCCHYSDIENNKALIHLKNSCRNILESGIQAKYTQPVSITALREKLYYKLTQNTATHRFLPNTINFCDITSNWCIPCKVICFLGMNDDAFPRSKVFPDFNLIVKNPRKNDNDIYEKDRYTFLLALLLAQKQIYISFIGRSIYDNTMNYPSMLVNELFEYIALNFCLKEHKNTEIDINIQYIRQHLFRWYNPFPFSFANFNPGTNKQSFAEEWLFKPNFNINSLSICSSFNTPLPHYAIQTITFQDLYNFYRHPVRTWFQKRLNVYFDRNIITKLLHDEPFFLDGLDRYELNMQLIDYLIHDKNINELYDNIRASGILPCGVFGELHWIKQHKKMIKLANQIKIFHCIKKYHLDISLTFDTLKLVGQLTMIQENGLIRWNPQYFSMKDILLLWLEHITYCSMGGKGDSRLFGINGTWHFPNFSILQAKKLLLILILGYCVGMNTPVFLLYHSGGAWMNHVFDWNTRTISSNLSCKKEACRKLIQAWKGNKYSFFRESQDPYLRKLIPFDLSDENIEKISETAEYYLLNIMKYRVI